VAEVNRDQRFLGVRPDTSLTGDSYSDQATPADLRRGAQALRDADGEPNNELRGTLIKDIPNGFGHVIRVLWRPDPPKGGPHLSIRVWRETPNGETYPVRDLGIEIAVSRLAALGDAVADALEIARDNVTEFRRRNPRRR
jgi:hypothetical protein